MSGNESLNRSWEIVRLRNEIAAYKEAMAEMFSELLDSYDGYDRAEAKAYWIARFDFLKEINHER